MAAKLVIVKQKRETTDVEFFTATEEMKAAVTADTTVRGIAGERNFKGGLTKIRTIFFPTVELYDAWVASTACNRHAKLSSLIF